MMDINSFLDQFDKQIKKNQRFKAGNSEYGSNVMPLLQLYENLTTYDERKSFRDALEIFLVDPSEERRKFAIDICLGFIVFKDAI